MAAAPIFPVTIVNASTTLNNASGTTAVTIFTAGASGSRIDAVTATSTDTANRDAQVLAGGNLVGTIAVPLAAGTASTTPSKSVMADANLTLPVTDPYGNKVIYLAAGQTLQILMPVAITAAKQIVFTVMGGSF